MTAFSLSNPLYKYNKRRHNEALVHEGEIRIGTLVEFRDTKKFGEVVGDSMEGFRSARTSGDTHIVSYKAPGLEIRDVGISGWGDANTAFKHQEVSPDFHMYCTSSIYEEETMKKFYADSCVIIEDPELFFGVISAELIRRGFTNDSFPLIKPCVYQQKDIVLYGKKISVSKLKQPPIWLQKDPSYGYQKEVRALWHPIDTSPDSVILKVPALTKACRMYV